MNKKLISGLLAVIMLLSLAGCGGSSGMDGTVESEVQTTALQAGNADITSTGFTDVPAGADYAEAVAWCYANGILNGTTTTTFAPDATLTRAMLATAIYRAAGELTVSGNPAFSDTQADSWYSNAVVWANDQGIIQGYGNGLFGTNDPVSVEQLQVILDRYQGRGNTWKGNPALAVPATRAQVAVALYENLRNADNGNKTLVVYFSATGSTERVAGYIAETVGADLFELEPVEPYTSADLNYNNDSSRVSREHNDTSLQDIELVKTTPDKWEEYDVVFLGYPIWYGDMPMAVYTFMESYDWNGKTVIPFCTHAGSGLAGTVSSIKTALSDATVLDGLAISGTDAQNKQDSAQASVRDWLGELNLNLSGAASGKSVVYMTTDISPEGLMAVYQALNWRPTGNVAVKLSTGEPPASNYLDPNLIKDVVQEVDGTIVECNTTYGGSRATTAMHYQVAKDHSFTDIAEVVILDENGSLSLPVTGGTQLTENYVGAHFSDYDSYLVLSHFKGHAMAGFGGAIKNISIGLGSSEGKCWIHSAGASRTNPWGGNQDDFLESMGEAGKSVVDALDGQIVYINVMNRLSVDCDCDGNPVEPDMHDIGILASTDPVALDQACVDLVYAAEDGGSLIARIESRNGTHTLEHAEEIGLGNREYNLTSVDVS